MTGKIYLASPHGLAHRLTAKDEKTALTRRNLALFVEITFITGILLPHKKENSEVDE